MSRVEFRRLLLLIVVVAAGVVLYSRARARTAAPCTVPIAYSIGKVDARFNVTNETLMAAAAAASDIWNQAAGRKVFAFDAAAPLKINLIYDAREANATLGVSLDEQKAAQDSARVRLEALQAWFTASQAGYNQEISAVNARGGATPAEAQSLAAEKASLTVLADSIARLSAAFNDRVSAFNSGVEQFNQQAGQVHQVGRYVSDSTGERIDVFKFIGDTELTRFLAHEFGHALGLDHNGNPASIMYEMNETGNLTPSPEDRASLQKVCGRGT